MAKSKRIDNYLDFIKQNSALIQRIGSAFVLAPLVILCIFYGGVVFMLFVMAAALVSCHEWYNMVKALPSAILLMISGMFYLSLSYGSFIFIRFGFEQGAWLTLVVMMCVWSSDIMAYLFGKTFQGPKMCPQISPNKTWAGLGGAVIGFTVILILSFALMPLNLKDFPFMLLFFVGPVLGVAAQGGDLMISILKRKAGLKDTGHLIPGHGGLLDRIDALMLIAPLSALLLVLLQG